MTRLGAAFWVALVLASGFTTFQVKYAVQRIDDELNRVRKQAIAEQQEIRVLAAEWTYLNQPERLAELSRAFLKLTPITTKQLQQRIEDLPWRAPSEGPDIVVAARPPAASLPVATLAAAVPPIARLPAAAARAVANAAPVRSAAPLPVRLAKAAPGSLDALFAQIAEAR